MVLARKFILRQVDRSSGIGTEGAIISNRPCAHKSKSLPDGFSRSRRGLLVIRMSLAPDNSASFLMSFSLWLMNGETSTPPFAAV